MGSSPEMAANLGNILHNPTAQIGMQTALSIGQDYVNKNVLQDRKILANLVMCVAEPMDLIRHVQALL
jgi:hypothetical protein